MQRGSRPKFLGTSGLSLYRAHPDGGAGAFTATGQRFALRLRQIELWGLPRMPGGRAGGLSPCWKLVSQSVGQSHPHWLTLLGLGPLQPRRA